MSATSAKTPERNWLTIVKGEYSGLVMEHTGGKQADGSNSSFGETVVKGLHDLLADKSQ